MSDLVLDKAQALAKGESMLIAYRVLAGRRRAGRISHVLLAARKAINATGPGRRPASADLRAFHHIRRQGGQVREAFNSRRSP